MTRVSDSQKITFRSKVLTWLLNKRYANSTSFMGECNTVSCRKTRDDTMCKIGSESHYILSLDALSASSCNRLNTREKSLKSAVGYQTV
jgi:hypothetical protein